MIRKKWLVLIIIIILITGGIYLFARREKAEAPAVPAADNQSTNNPIAENISQESVVNIENFSFSPPGAKNQKEEAVAWLNKDSAAHTIVSDSGNELSSATLSKGKIYFHTFNSTGTFAYHCGIHPSMKAKITVE